MIFRNIKTLDPEVLNQISDLNLRIVKNFTLKKIKK